VNSLDDVRRIVHQEFLRWFETEETTGPESSYNGIAQEIWDKFVKRGAVGEQGWKHGVCNLVRHFGFSDAVRRLLARPFLSEAL
jgi:hypothetical protein